MARVVYISSTFPGYKKCGVGIYAGYLTRALADQGHEIHVVTTNIPEITSTLGKVKIHKILNTWTLSEIPKLTELFKRVKPDLLHINHPTSIAGKKTKTLVNLLPEINKILWKLPTVTTLHEFNNVSLLGKIKLLPLILGTDALTVTNRRYAECVQRFVPLLKTSKINIVNIGCAFDENLPEPNQNVQKKRWNLNPGDKVVGFVGFITPPKGFHNLIAAVAPLMRDDPQIKVLALSSWNLSSQEYKERILKQIEREGISSRVMISDYLEDNELWAAMDAVDVCVFPFDEPVEERSSAPLRQVLFKGLPTIVTARRLDYSEFGLSHKKNIWLTPFQDIEKLREDILTVVGDAEVQKTLSAGAKALRPSLSFKGISNSMGQVYSKLLALSQA